MSRSLTADERDLLGELLDDVYEQFVGVVSLERGIPLDDVRDFADGRLMTGRQAFELGLVDRLGDLRDAVLVAGDLAGIAGEPSVIRPRRRALSIWDIIEDLLGFASKVARDGVSLEYSLR